MNSFFMLYFNVMCSETNRDARLKATNNTVSTDPTKLFRTYIYFNRIHY